MITSYAHGFGCLRTFSGPIFFRIRYCKNSAHNSDDQFDLDVTLPTSIQLMYNLVALQAGAQNGRSTLLYKRREGKHAQNLCKTY